MKTEKKSMRGTISNSMDCGKLPPQDIDSENSVLSALIIDNKAIIDVSTKISSDSFYKEENKLVYKAIHDLYTQGKDIDILTISDQLKKNSNLDLVGGIAFISQLSGFVNSSYHVMAHAEIVQQKYIARRLISFGYSIYETAFDDSVSIQEVMDKAQNELYEICNSTSAKKSRSLKEIGRVVLRELEIQSKLNRVFTGIPSGYNKIDRITSGWQNTDLIILAARPSMGKTMVALHFIINAAKSGYPVDVYSLEMSDSQLYTRSLSLESKVENGFIRSAQMNEDQWQSIDIGHGKLEDLPIQINDTPSLNINDFRSMAISNKMKYGTKLIVVDYLQLMTSSEYKGYREQEVSHISKTLKATAKELNVPIIALSQLNRSVESRGGSKRPGLSDLRESGSIEQDADMVLFIHRPEYYGIMENEEGNSTVNIVEILTRKHRNGPLVDWTLYKDKNWTNLSDSLPCYIPEHYTNKDLDDVIEF